MKRLLQRKFFLVPLLLLTTVMLSWGQTRVITGKVTSKEDGSATPGVNIVLKGTAVGTQTDVDGAFTLSVPEAGGILVFSYIGQKTLEVEIGNLSVVNASLEADSKQLAEIVVTAMGIEQSKKSLGYSVTKVNRDDIIQARTSSVVSGLQGKVAGVQISGSSGAPGSSSKVIVRGFSSLSGSNNPLYVVDGMPINNSFTGSTSINGGTDFGSRVNDINPDDIESINILKGAAATALYGSRAASGVIIITTKNGKDAASRGKKAEVTYASSLVMDNVLKTPDFQNKFGQGFFGIPAFNENTSWGPKFDGQDHVWGRIVDNQQRIKPYVGLPNNVKDFFETGSTFTNSVSLQGGNDKSSYYTSFSNVTADGIMPTDVDSYKRNTFSLRASTQLANRITTSATINYARTQSSFVTTGQGSSVFNQILQTPRDISLLELEDINDKFNDVEGYYSEFTVNPWYALKKFKSQALIERLYGNAELNWKATDWLNVTERIGTDFSQTNSEGWQPKTVITGPNSSRSNPGSYGVGSLYSRELNSDLIVNINRDLSPEFNISGLIGWNVNQRQSSSLNSGINDLVIPGFYNLSNTANTPSSSTSFSLRRLMGLYGQATVSYNDYAFLTVGGRNDWSSTLPKVSRSFFYPSVSLGLDLTSAFKIESNTLSYAKVRAAWAQAGKDASPYSVLPVFTKLSNSDGFVSGNSPIAQTIPAFAVGNTIGNSNLQPEISTDIEFGTDVRFLNNRIGLDATVYQRKVQDNILTVPLTASTGYSSQVINIAKLTNKGVELLLTATPVLKNNFKWDVSVNWSKNVSKITDLGGPTQITVGGLGGATLIARVGGPAFEIQGARALKDAEGRTVVNASGLPIAGPATSILGNTQYKWFGGITNKFTYKGISLSCTFDVRNGGIAYSRTASLMYFAGTAPQTTYNNREPFILPNSGLQVVDASGNPALDEHGLPVTQENRAPITHQQNGQLYSYWGGGGSNFNKAFLISKSFVKLREVVVSYSLPKSLLSKTPFGNVSLSLIGRNLLLWLPKENVFADPEATTFGNDIGSEFGEFGATPTTRSYGFNLRVTF